MLLVGVAAAVVMAVVAVVVLGGGDDDSPTAAAGSEGAATTVPSGDATTTSADATTTTADEDAGTTGSSGGDGPSADPAGSIADLLRWVPADVDGPIVVTDLARARDAAGITPPVDDDDASRYLIEVAGGPVDPDGRVLPAAPSVGLDASPFDLDAWRQAFGFAPPDVLAAVEAGSPPGMITVYRVPVPGDVIVEAAVTDPDWFDRVTPATHAGIAFLDWGRDGEVDLSRAGGPRPLGRGGQLAAVDGVAIRTVMRDSMERALEAGATGRSIVDQPEVAQVVAALDGIGVHGLVLVAGAVFPVVDLVADDAVPVAESLLADGLVLVRPTWLGAGTALVDGVRLDVVVLQHADPASAAENAERFTAIVERGTSLTSGEPWRDRLTLRSVTVDGTLVVAELEVEPTRRGVWLEALYTRDSLYWIDPG